VTQARTLRWARVLLVANALAASASAQSSRFGAPRSVRVIEDAPAQAPARPQNAPPDPAKSDGLRVELLPRRDFSIGEPMRFRVTTDKAGYLLLVDVDAHGRTTQIFPNVASLSATSGVDAHVNYLRAGQSVTIPQGGSADAYAFVASPPTGVGMAIALLSDAPVQIIDLPDAPPALVGAPQVLDFVKESARALDLLPAGADRPARRPKWSFAAAYYSIR
jgi:hypothetical protein